MSILSLFTCSGLATLALVASVVHTAIWSRRRNRQQRALTVLRIILGRSDQIEPRGKRRKRVR